MAEVREISVLVVDDKVAEDIMLYLKGDYSGTLKRQGIKVVSADYVNSGEAALDYLKQKETLPDFILTDYQMPPGMDGIATINAITDYCSEKGITRPKIILHTALADFIPEGKKIGHFPKHRADAISGKDIDEMIEGILSLL